MFIKLLILSVLLLAIAVAAMAIRMLLVRGGKFPVFSIGRNTNMHKKGIRCPASEEICRRKRQLSGGCCYSHRGRFNRPE